MKDFSKTRRDFVKPKSRRDSIPLDFFVDKCDIHGRLGEIVYRHKRNGEFYSYPYEYIPKYDPTVLSRRPECVFRAAAKITNSSLPGYKEIVDKMYYYTPFFVFPGNYSFCCNTFFKLRKKGEYSLQIDEGMKFITRLAPRTMVKFGFAEPGKHTIRFYKGEELYCKRQVTVISAQSDIKELYADWFAAHLGEILQMPDPQFARMEKYFRCVIPPNWILSMAGECENFVLYSTGKSHLELGDNKYKIYMYSRSLIAFTPSVQNNYFGNVQPRVTKCWMGVSAKFRQVWKKYYGSWFDANYRKTWKKTSNNNFWSQLIYRAGNELGFDMESLSMSHFLTGIETIGDLIVVTGMGSYGLGEEELKTKIYLATDYTD